MAETVRIEAAAHAALTELARAKHFTLTEALSRAVEALRREVFFEALNAGYAELRADSKAWAQDEAERALWDRTLADGLEEEPPYPLETLSPGPARPLRKKKSKTRARSGRSK